MVGASGAGGAAPAAAECLSNPGRTAAPGSRWYYRIDRATQRKCWYLKPSDARTAAPRQDAESQPQLLSWLSSAISSLTRSTPDLEVAAREPSPQALEAARKRTQAKRPDAGRAASRSSPQPAASSAEAPTLDPAASEALYQQFLQWRVQQLLAPELPPDLQGRSPGRAFDR